MSMGWVTQKKCVLGMSMGWVTQKKWVLSMSMGWVTQKKWVLGMGMGFEYDTQHPTQNRKKRVHIYGLVP
jgi:hypothetical protein